VVDFSIEVHGLKELEAELLELGAKIAGSELRGALNVAGKIVADAMKANAPVYSDGPSHAFTVDGKRVTVPAGYIRSRIKRSSRLNARGVSRYGFRGNSIAKVKIGVRDVPYIGAIEFGAENRAPNPFIRRSLLENVEPVTNKFKQELRRRIDKHLATRRAKR